MCSAYLGHVVEACAVHMLYFLSLGCEEGEWIERLVGWLFAASNELRVIEQLGCEADYGLVRSVVFTEEYLTWEVQGVRVIQTLK